jgi:tRNA (cytidine56-2'-O)-methyltransferase
MPRITVLRLGHRFERDARVTSHVALAARALGADEIVMADVKDERIKKTVDEISTNWGGHFEVKMGVPWREFVNDWQSKGGEVIHLTMYGQPLSEVINDIRRSTKDKLIVIGATKVPGEVYRTADYNLAVSSQPHSECSALAIFLHELFQGRELEKRFPGAKIKIVPQEKGKRIVRLR